MTHFFILFSKNALLSLICRLYENEPDPSIYISTNRGQTLHIFCKIRKNWEFSRLIICVCVVLSQNRFHKLYSNQGAYNTITVLIVTTNNKRKQYVQNIKVVPKSLLKND